MNLHVILRAALLASGLLAVMSCNRNSGSAAQEGQGRASHAQAKTEGATAAGKPPGVPEKCPHDALKADCFICDPALRDKGRLWCKEHGRYEDRCFLCHPEIEEEGRAYCGKHFLYDDECFLCRPELKQQGRKSDGKADGKADGESDGGGSAGGEASAAGVTEVASHAIEAPGLLCREHGVLERECGICHPDLITGLKTGEGLKVRLASAESARKGGLETGKPEVDTGVGGPAFLSRVAYNGNQFAHITSLAPGIVQKVHVDFGAQVRKGQILVEIASPDIARAKSAYLSALSDLNLKELAYRREKSLAEKDVTSRQEFEQAEAEYRKARNESASARQELLNFGMSEADLSALVKSGATTSALPIRAPFAGTVIERKAVAGEAVNPEAPLFAIGDLSTMWLELSLPPDAGAGIAVGDPVAAGFDALPGVQFPGKLIWISPGIDGTTRMLKARAVVENPKGILKDGMFGKVRIPTAKGGKRLGLPTGAIQRIEGADFVFVKLEEDLYEARKVWLEEGMDGADGGSGTTVTLLAGLDPGEDVVFTGTFAMKTELLKSRLGAGCTDGH